MFEFLRGTLVKLKRHYHKMINRKIKYAQYSSKIKDTWSIQKASKTVIRNELENQFYNIDRTYTYHFPEVKLYQLNDIYLAGKEAWPFLHLNNIFQPAINSYDQSQERIKRPVNFLAKQQTGTIFHLAGPNSGNKGHFLIEHLPRLLSSIEVLNTIPDYSILLLPQRGKAHIPLLNKLEISPNKYVDPSKGTTKCQQVLYSPLLTENRNQYLAPPQVYLEIKNRVIRNTKIAKIERLAVFISRRDAPDRYMLNEEDIYNFLKGYWPDLKLIKLSEHGLDEQINLFNNARVIVGPHGQGFRNLLYTNQCLGIQLHFGENFTNEWCVVYNNIACISGNYGIALYSGKHPDHNGNWYYPKELLSNHMNKLSSILPSYFK